MVARRELAKALQRPEQQANEPPPRTRGRPSLYTQELGERICARLATGETLREICRDPDMPDEKAVRLWAMDEERAPEFVPQYARARELGYESIAEQILGFGLNDYRGPDGFVDNGEIQRLRLLSDNRKWLLSKMQPKRYGDKVTTEVTGEDGGPLITRIELVPVAARPRTIEHDDSVNGSPAEARTPKGTRKRLKL